MLKLFTIKKNVTVDIPEPCGEDWDRMRPVPGGRHCEMCAKKVTDFSGMSGAELVRYANANGKICGRINSEFLGKPLEVETPKKGGVLGLLLRAAVLVGITSSVQAKAAPAYAIHHNNVIPVDEPTQRSVHIKLLVTDEATGIRLRNSLVIINNTNEYYTDTNGWIVTDYLLPQLTDTAINLTIKSHFYKDHTEAIMVEDDMDLSVALQRVDIPDNTVFGVVGLGRTYTATPGIVTIYKDRITVFERPVLSADVNEFGEYMLTLPDSMIGKRYYINRLTSTNYVTDAVIHTDGIDVTQEPMQMDFLEFEAGNFFPFEPIIREPIGGVPMIEYKWEWAVPFLNIGTLVTVTQVNWTGTEIYVRAPFTRRNLPLYKSHWFRGE